MMTDDDRKKKPGGLLNRLGMYIGKYPMLRTSEAPKTRRERALLVRDVCAAQTKLERHASL